MQLICLKQHGVITMFRTSSCYKMKPILKDRYPALDKNIFTKYTKRKRDIAQN